jgi:hypothetical protein
MIISFYFSLNLLHFLLLFTFLFSTFLLSIFFSSFHTSLWDWFPWGNHVIRLAETFSCSEGVIDTPGMELGWKIPWNSFTSLI